MHQYVQLGWPTLVYFEYLRITTISKYINEVVTVWMGEQSSEFDLILTQSDIMYG